MVVRPRWQWRLVAADGTDVERPGSPVFLARFEAEQWLGEHWRALARQGVRRAVLQNDGADLRPAVELPAD
ncbi:hypothetical protein [Cellulomonas dongxiuzhuiae]|uniref:DUF2188 domain-containing protein n=1 Tax=Cellulomonas dongxiuzhuiae TaxID=2819979 RepID=A0ABX8GFA7_9CELL|nr:hypothetical protein [Cellulomonas dongxiuzhuiae]MBO3086937.1 hypothetical protein [Cellulomonas dongxiuzhuiae]MBO3093706.1 hypothetical protein [Cellulomonas dongxiuzhuiae]QWC14814.1 hypothetical protein KKR89_10615 [Cellulomonas dongxiuzhuiae]